jgi:hypothetical protein
MLRNLKQIEGRALRARGGVIGGVKDVFFDDHQWHVRYLVVETGAWLKKREVLISPSVLGPVDWGQQSFPDALTRDQVRYSPSVDTAKPVSRQHEEALRQYYSWPAYWGPVLAEGGMVEPLTTPIPAGNSAEPGYTDGEAPLRRQDPFLRSAKDTLNYHIEARDGAIGHVEEFLFDDEAWRVRYLVIDTRNWLPGKKVIIAPEWIRDVSWEQRRVFVDLTREAIEGSPPYDASAPWNHAYSVQLHDYYGRPRYSDWNKDKTAGTPPLSAL